MPADFYRVLGILPNAPDEVIKAVYRALAKKYHPDAGGDPDRFRAISDAYSVLSDPVRRREYDNLHSSPYFSEHDTVDMYEDVEGSWNEAIRNIPELDLLYWKLKSFSNSLASYFKIKLLETKAYGNAIQIHNELEDAFFLKYFGTSVKIHNFAKFLLIDGHRDAAVQLNKMIVSQNGRPSDGSMISKVCQQYGLVYYRMNESSRQEEPY